MIKNTGFYEASLTDEKYKKIYNSASKNEIPDCFEKISKYAEHLYEESRMRYMRFDQALVRFENFVKIQNLQIPGCFALFDDNGFLLKYSGNTEIAEKLKAAGAVEGSSWNIEDIGPNAVSIGMSKKINVISRGNDNYCKVLKNYDLYFMDLTDERMHPSHAISPENQPTIHFLCAGFALIVPLNADSDMCRALASSVYYNLLLHLYFLNSEAMNSIENKHWNLNICKDPASNEVIFTSSDRGIYKKFFDFLGIEPIDLYMRPVSVLFDPLPANERLWKIINLGEDIKDEEITLSIKGKNKTCVISAHSFSQSSISFSGMILNLTTPQRMAKQISKKTGNNAVRTFSDFVGTSLPVKSAIRKARMAANTDSNIMILGESGTGKDVLAQAIHNAGERSDRPFVAVNCAAIPRDLIASELFGYDGGAFTGAKKQGNMGKFELADGGTLFLDEIGEMPLDLQATLLRAVEQKTFSRLGSTNEIEVDVRIISATNANLQEMIAAKRFREDLFYRLSTLRINLPPLRERDEDAVILAQTFADKIALRLGHDYSKHLTDEAKALILNYEWPGNIRELQNVIEAVVQIYPGTEVTAEQIREYLDIDYKLYRELTAPKSPNSKDFSKEDIVDALVKTGGNRSEAAKLLDVSRRTFYRYLEKYSLA